MRILIALTVALVAVVYSASAFAQCSCDRTKDRDESLRTAKYVFWGEAQRDDDGELQLRVKANYKGTRNKRTHPVAGGECAFEFEEGEHYMVFADRGEEKREISVDRCNATTQLDHQPMTAMIWNLAEELVYGTSRRWTTRHGKGRRTLTDRSIRKIKWSIGKCDSETWDESELKAKIEVRFDIEPDGNYEHELLTYETPTRPSAEVMQCLEQRLAEDNFKSFPGGRVSVSAYWLVDRVDKSFGRDEAKAVVVPFGGHQDDRPQ